ncbi:sensor domain-containing diguanylate cyclase [Pseudoteredinibacter isoporae]|uniref:diguanylate cyclase n=1 Tax=Pseudoteredinibacter isoporae TaxID=570281 RepID=A0A7X0JY12_9GAMM|nr:diguanylate cyclase [Pseudoteredinibacter isoporae]MBB6523630.1 diguanylate cyclase (GGDEF)-like protein [Pseudoteredinibacter isoporae]NHO89137.1 diguanylate cyclase [Pseudoteredinibacter isoporae]NIB22252.1 diguanylate cyclase [Pseudoteredinibacter isoporae]
MSELKRCFRNYPPEALDLDQWQTTVDLISRIYGTACGAIVQFNGDEFTALSSSSNDDNFIGPGDTWAWEVKSFCRRVVETRNQLYVNNAVGQKEWSDAPPVCSGPVRSYLGFPIFWPDGEIFGTICSIDTKATEYEESFVDLMAQLRDLVSGELQHLWDIEKLQQVAITDSLTGLYNVRGIRSLGQQRINDQQRFGLELGLIYFDVDNLKLLNDNFGHHKGDECLVAVSDALKNSFRKTDIIARVGGDEFVVIALCQAGSESELRQSCHDACEAFQREFSHQYVGINLDVSFGLKCFSKVDSSDLDTMITEVDSLMYQEKKNRAVNE